MMTSQEIYDLVAYYMKEILACLVGMKIYLLNEIFYRCLG